MIDALILNYNDYRTTFKCIENLQKCTSIRHILVVDNCSTDNSYEKFKQYKNPRVEFIRTGLNQGYGSGNNIGINYLNRKYSSRFILQCNPDTIVDNSTLLKMENFLEEHKEYAVVAPIMMNCKGEKVIGTGWKSPTKIEYILSFGLLYSKFFQKNTYADLLTTDRIYYDVDAVAGSLLMYRTKYMLEYGMYDENIFLYCEENVLGFKLKKAKLKSAVLSQEAFVHQHSVSINKAYKSSFKKGRLLIQSKLYVLKEYLNTKGVYSIFAWIMAVVYMIEHLVVDGKAKITSVREYYSNET